MIGHLRRNAVAYVALFVALGGTSYAAVKLPKNSVGTKQLKAKAVTPAKVAPDTVNLFKGQKGDTGAPGAKGDKGDAGTPGAAGAPNPNADKLDGFDANGLVRLAHGEDEVGTTGSAALVTVNITAPAAGQVLVVGSSDGYNFTANDTATCYIVVDSTANTASTREMTFGGMGSNDEDEDCATNTAVSVSAGPHTVVLQTGSAATTHWGKSTLDVVYIPFNGTGA